MRVETSKGSPELELKQLWDARHDAGSQTQGPLQEQCAL